MVKSALRSFAIRLLVAFFLAATTAILTASALDPLPPERWPKTIEATVADLLQIMADTDKERVRTTAFRDLILFHHGLGTGIRNHYGLWRGNIDLLVSACGIPCHPDDASMHIIEAVWKALQK